MTSSTALKVTGIFVSALLAAGCDETRGGTDESREEVGGGQEAQVGAEPRAEASDASMVEIERVLRRVERGSATDADVKALAAIVADAKLPAEALDRASLGLSKAYEAQGDTEAAVVAVEELMKRHAGDGSFEAHEAAQRRLRLLLSGTEETPTNFQQNMDPMAPFAKVLAPYFPEDDRGVSLIDIVVVGKSPTSSDPHGIFNLRGAKRELAEAACSVCEIDIKAQRSHTRIDSWSELPLQLGEQRLDMPNPDRSMVVVYFDLEQNRVPSRYDAYLAVPSDETVARLEKGEAFVAVRERPGKKPLLMLAAPRAGQLDEVETELAKMTTLPTTPRTVEVPKKLLPAEIQGVVRQHFNQFRACYEKLLGVDPKAAGRIAAKFRIKVDGSVESVTTDSTFTDTGIATCVGDHFAKLRFSANADSVTVTYPIVFSP